VSAASGLRRYVNGGRCAATVGAGHGEITLPHGEERYLRQHWQTLSSLRHALRTEHEVRLAVLFGSVAVGEDRPDSDVDLLIEHATADPSEVVELQQRLRRRVGRSVHVVLVEDAEQSPVLLTDVLIEGLALVDRDDVWQRLEGMRDKILPLAEAEERRVQEGARRAVAEARERLSE